MIELIGLTKRYRSVLAVDDLTFTVARGDAMTAAPIRVVLVDDQAVVRVGFRTLLELTTDIAVVGEATNGREAIDVVTATRPDVVVMDIRMPEVDGLVATRQIAADPSLDAVRILVLTTFEADEYVFDALRAGASGFLVKDVEPDELYMAIRSVAAGQGALAPSVAKLLVAYESGLVTVDDR